MLRIKYFFESLKSAPEDVKKTFAVSASVVLTVMIVFFSFVTVNPLSAGIEKKEESNDKKLISPLTSLTRGIGNAFGGLRDEFTQIPVKEIINALTTKKEAPAVLGNLITSTNTASAAFSVSTTTRATSTLPVKEIAIAKPPTLTIPIGTKVIKPAILTIRSEPTSSTTAKIITGFSTVATSISTSTVDKEAKSTTTKSH